MSIFGKLFKAKDSSPASIDPQDKQARADNLAFLRAMQEVAKLDSAETRRALYESMQRAWFLVPTDRADGQPVVGRYVSDGSRQLSLPILRDSQGKKVVPTFTDEEALAQWSGATLWFAMQGAAFFPCLVRTEAEEIAVNPPRPGQPLNRPAGRITRAEFEALAEGRIPQATGAGIKLAKGQKVLIGIPAQMPGQGVLNALAAAARSQPNIRGLYLCQMVVGENAAQKSIAIAVDILPGATQAQAESLVAALGSAIQPLLSKSERFDFLPALKSGGLTDVIMKQGKAIYIA
jgi:hypothetical protein